MHPEERGVQEQAVQHYLFQAAARLRLVLAADRLAHLVDGGLGERRLATERIS
jgi:hypothetical protein